MRNRAPHAEDSFDRQFASRVMKDDGRIDSIRAILLKCWDPLGVGDNPHLAQLETHLVKIEKERSGGVPSRGTARLAATKLLASWVASQRND
ncbi:hypothetical protein CU048_07230 [Beijerinckiaceae bacterium]|nr:hypothetical protein CU048_07230 [Beijerinckiaceae bacterium]